MNTGIDYGLGKTNISEDGFRYGVISQNSLHGDACEDIFFGPHSKDMNFENWKEELKQALRNAMDSFMTTNMRERFVEYAMEWDWMGDCYSGDEISPRYDDGKYVIERCLDTDLVITKSPYYTHAQFCSPCVPGAGNLDSPCPDGPKTLCLGHEWFENGAPYPVYRVDNN